MTKEVRRIFFENEDIKFALHDFGKGLGVELPEGQIVKITPIKANQEFKIIFSKNEETHEICIKPHLILACLIRLCHKKQIPLPMESKKSLQISDGLLCMNITINIPTFAESA